jgi:hypothetical protein
MARPQVADGGDGLQIWRIAENILNKQSQKAELGGPVIMKAYHCCQPHTKFYPKFFSLG